MITKDLLAFQSMPRLLDPVWVPFCMIMVSPADAISMADVKWLIGLSTPPRSALVLVSAKALPPMVATYHFGPRYLGVTEIDFEVAPTSPLLVSWAATLNV